MTETDEKAEKLLEECAEPLFDIVYDKLKTDVTDPENRHQSILKALIYVKIMNRVEYAVKRRVLNSEQGVTPAERRQILKEVCDPDTLRTNHDWVLSFIEDFLDESLEEEVKQLNNEFSKNVHREAKAMVPSWYKTWGIGIAASLSTLVISKVVGALYAGKWGSLSEFIEHILLSFSGYGVFA